MCSHHQSNKRPLTCFFALLLLMAVVLSACGDPESANLGAAASGGEAAQTAAGSSGAPAAGDGEASPEAEARKTISTVNGEIGIPLHPKRIVAEEYLGSLIALDIIPVGAPGLTLQNYYFKEALTGVADTGVYGKPSAEHILALQPDLIITGNGENYDLLSKIAPTVVIPYGELKNAHEELSYFGKLFGKEAEAKAWLEAYDRRIAAARAAVDAAIPPDAAFSIMEYADKTTWVYGDNFGRGGQPVYQALGRKPPAGIAQELMDKQWAEISDEVLEQYAGDYIIMTSNVRTVDDFRADPIWGNLPAVKNNQLYIWPEERSWYYDPLAVLAQTEELAGWLANQAAH